MPTAAGDTKRTRAANDRSLTLIEIRSTLNSVPSSIQAGQGRRLRGRQRSRSDRGGWNRGKMRPTYLTRRCAHAGSRRGFPDYLGRRQSAQVCWPRWRPASLAARRDMPLPRPRDIRGPTTAGQRPSQPPRHHCACGSRHDRAQCRPPRGPYPKRAAVSVSPS